MCVKPTKKSSKLLTILLTQVIYRRRPSKRRRVKSTESSRGFSVYVALNKTSPIPPSGPGSKKK